jgi:hypothetical protein
MPVFRSEKRLLKPRRIACPQGNIALFAFVQCLWTLALGVLKTGLAFFNTSGGRLPYGTKVAMILF